MIAVRPAEPCDLRQFYGKDPPAIFTALLGERDGVILGIGGITWDENGVAWAFFDTTERPPLTMHRAAIRLFAALREVGEPAVYTACQRSVPGAAKWLRRLGFEEMPKMNDADEVIWKWLP